MQERCRAEHRGASWHLRSKRRQSLAQCCLTAIDDLLGLGLMLLVLRPKICRLKRLQRLPPGPLHHADYWSPITDHCSLARPRPSCGPPPCWPRGHPSPPKAFGADTGGALKLCLRLTHRRLVRYWLSSNCSFAGGHSDVVARPPAFSMCFIAGELNRKE